VGVAGIKTVGATVLIKTLGATVLDEFVGVRVGV